MGRLNARKQLYLLQGNGRKSGVAKELLELLLDIKIDRLERPQSEKQFKTDFVSRGIRFDVYVKDTA